MGWWRVRSFSRRGRRWWATGLVVIMVGAAWVGWRRPRASTCAQEAQSGNPQRAVSICLASYRESKDEQDALWLARAYLHLDQRTEASQWAKVLLAGRRRGDAHQILSYCAMRDGNTAAAIVHANLAIAEHTLSKDELGLVSDQTLLSQAAWQAGDFTTALTAADRALGRLEQRPDAHKEVVALIARADALRRMGDLRGASEAARKAIARASTSRDRAWAHLKHAMCVAEAGQESLALLELAAASAADRQGNAPVVAWQIALNESFLLRKRDPGGALARLDEVERLAGEALEIWLQRGYLAADRGDLEEAERSFTRAEAADEPDADWLWEVALARAQLAERRGSPLDLVAAEQHYRRATAMVAALRSTARARSAYLVSSHRAPYDGLLTLLARQGRWRDVLTVLLELDASDMLRATAEERIAADRRELDVSAANPTSAPLPVSEVTPEEVLAAWRGRELVIVLAESPRQIAAQPERVYRLRISDGELSGQDVGAASDARAWAATLFARPGDREAARGLGKMIVGSGEAKPAAGTLDVLAVGSLGKAPLAALRDEDDRLIIGARPLARVLALRARRPPSRGEGAPVVMADPQRNLPSAAAEGTLVAEVLAPRARVFGTSGRPEATKEALWEARDAMLLHFAGHASQRGPWRALQLADGPADAAELLERRLAPRLAVLASCGSAAATDAEGWGSIAAALLEAGTSFVVATDRSIGDRQALALMKAFYSQADWRVEPARALASAQRAMASEPAGSPSGAGSPGTSDGWWAAFSLIARPPAVVASSSPEASQGLEPSTAADRSSFPDEK